MKGSLEQAEIIIEKKTTLNNLQNDVQALSVQLSQLKDNLANTKAIHPTENRTDIASDYMDIVKQIYLIGNFQIQKPYHLNITLLLILYSVVREDSYMAKVNERFHLLQ